jgi:hypothetical protein
MSGTDCVRVVIDEILRGQILCLCEPLSFPGIALIPIRRVDCGLPRKIKLSRTILTEYVHKVIVGSLPQNACGILVLDSLGDVIAFKLHLDIAKFWERICFVERLVMKHYKESRKPISTDDATARAVSFLMRLKHQGPEGVMSSQSDYFVVSQKESINDINDDSELFASTSAVLYAAGR